ncbi:metal ABC transporter substrate-binding protein [Nocardioides sp.]|uniref:metal ABC transporter substrate-binding protein n=1 Tax=Nocardioides sp. TaxID=35761 RepID=UPI00261D89AA|nr:metal ABC transporter substrate-binding protein [Nocardioides sp.]MCW2737329.1 ABC-type metal ion transport system, surface component [Nocardioides sp.]
MSSVVRPIALAASLTTAFLFAGCGATADDSGNGRPAAAAFYPLAWVTGRVAGDGWSVQNLTQPGQEPHDLTLDVAQTAALERAELVVLEEGFQPAVDETAANVEAPVLDAASVVDLQPTAEDHADDGDDHGDDQRDLDPHFWLDPLLVADFGDAVGDELAEVDPDNAETYAANAADLRRDLETLDTEFSEGLATCERSTVVVSHEAFSYLSRYGLDFEAIVGLSPDAEPTAADLARLEQLVASDGVTTVFSERLGSAKSAETLAGDLGVTTAVLDPLEGLSDETSDEDYLSLMRENLTALQQANGCS